MADNAGKIKRHKSIQDWSAETRPREKAMRLGTTALTDAELLAILIGSGSPEEDAVSLMQRILDEQDNNLDLFCRLGYEDLIQYKGIGPAKAITILAATELATRRTSDDSLVKTCDNARAIYDILFKKMRDLTTEVCYVVAMDQRLHYLGDKQIASGGYTATIVDPRVALRYALSKNAVAMALAHNHPSGTLRPSREDDGLTMKVKQACDAVGIRFVDHLIVTGKGYYSYRENDKL